MSSSQDPPNNPGLARTRQYLGRKAKVTSAADAIFKRIAQQGEYKVRRPESRASHNEQTGAESSDVQTPHTNPESFNTQQRPTRNPAPFQLDPRFTPIDLSRRLSQDDAPEQPSARPVSRIASNRPLTNDELEDFDKEFEQLGPKTLPSRKDGSSVMSMRSSRPTRKVNNALTSTNWRVNSNQENVDRPVLNVQAPVFDPTRRANPELVIPLHLNPYKITKRYRTPEPTTSLKGLPITFIRSPASSRVFDAANAPKEMPRPQPTDDYLNQAVDDPVQASAPQRLLIILDLNGTCVHRAASHRPGTPRPHLKPFLEYLFEYHDVMVWSSAMPKNVNKMCRNIFTPDQLQKLVAMWTREDLRLGRLIATKIKGHKMLTWVWEALNPQKEDKSWLYDQTNTVLIDDTRLKAAAEPWNLLEVPEWDGHDQKDEILQKAIKYLELLRWTRDVSQYLHRHPPSFSTPVTVAGKTEETADSLAEDIATLDLAEK